MFIPRNHADLSLILSVPGSAWGRYTLKFLKRCAVQVRSTRTIHDNISWFESDLDAYLDNNVIARKMISYFPRRILTSDGGAAEIAPVPR